MCNSSWSTFVWNYLWFFIDAARVNLDAARADEIRVKLTSWKGGVCVAKLPQQIENIKSFVPEIKTLQ